MDTFFVRHGSKLDISDDTYQSLLNSKRIAIHYPHDRYSKGSGIDSESLDVSDYDGRAATSLKILKKLARDGGYVCATYKFGSTCIVGKVEPNSSIRLIRGKWRSQPEREAVLKSIKLSEFMTVRPEQKLNLLASQPQQGTICRWSAVGAQVMRLAEKVPMQAEASFLTPTQQEVMVSEALRLDLGNPFPRLKCLLMPVGRTLKDVDIFGLTEDGKYLLVQVTNHKAGNPNYLSKVGRLKRNAGNNIELIFVGAGSQSPYVDQESGVIHVGLQHLFDKFLATKNGVSWWEAMTRMLDYRSVQ